MSGSRGFDSESLGPDLPSASELFELCEHVCDGTAAAAQIARLTHTLKASGDARLLYRQFMELHGSIWLGANGGDADFPWGDLDPAVLAGGGSGAAAQQQRASAPAAPAAGFGADLPLPFQGVSDQDLPDPSTGGVGGLFYSLVGRWVVGASPPRAAAAALAGVTAVLLALTFGGMALIDRPAEEPAAPIAKSIRVALLTESHGCQWADGQVAVGADLFSGQRLQLLHGTARLEFDGGAKVLVESPSLFELVTTKSMRLEHGTVAVYVTGPQKEFNIVSPDASIVDLGTSFGVHRGVGGTTEVEVFEGAVEVYADGNDDDAHVLGVGASAQVGSQGDESAIKSVASHSDRFANLLAYLWSDMSADASGQDDSGGDGKPIVKCDFDDGPVPGAVDTFYGAARGRGWLTPWVAAGNPVGEIVTEKPLSGAGNPYLGVRFYRSYERAIARQYGERRGLDPTKPHVITWRWRFDGDPQDFGHEFWDRVYFYSNPYFRRNSWLTNGWLIGVAGGNEKGNGRKVHPMQWYAFDRQDGPTGRDFDRRNMVATGMLLKPGVIYHFAVVVYPETRQYDVAIRDDETTFTRMGLRFRDPSATVSNVLHFGASANDANDDMSFSIDSIRIEPLADRSLLEHMSPERADAEQPASPARDDSTGTNSPSTESVDTESVDQSRRNDP